MTVLHFLLMKCLASSCATLLSISCFSVIHRPLQYRAVAIFHFQKQLYEVIELSEMEKTCPTFNLTENGISSYSPASALARNVMCHVGWSEFLCLKDQVPLFTKNVRRFHFMFDSLFTSTAVFEYRLFCQAGGWWFIKLNFMWSGTILKENSFRKHFQGLEGNL